MNGIWFAWNRLYFFGTITVCLCLLQFNLLSFYLIGAGQKVFKPNWFNMCVEPICVTQCCVYLQNLDMCRTQFPNNKTMKKCVHTCYVSTLRTLIRIAIATTTATTITKSSKSQIHNDSFAESLAHSVCLVPLCYLVSNKS